MYVKFVKIDVPNSVIEVSWYEDSETEKVSVKCVSYSSDQRTEFESEVEGAAAYITAAGW